MLLKYHETASHNSSPVASTSNLSQANPDPVVSDQTPSNTCTTTSPTSDVVPPLKPVTPRRIDDANMISEILQRRPSSNVNKATASRRPKSLILSQNPNSRTFLAGVHEVADDVDGEQQMKPLRDQKKTSLPLCLRFPPAKSSSDQVLSNTSDA